MNLPDFLFIDDANAGPTAFDSLLTFLHLKRIEIDPAVTNKSTKADKAMMTMVLIFIFWLLPKKSAVIGRSPELAVGPLPVEVPKGSEEDIPAKNTSKVSYINQTGTADNTEMPFSRAEIATWITNGYNFIGAKERHIKGYFIVPKSLVCQYCCSIIKLFS